MVLYFGEDTMLRTIGEFFRVGKEMKSFKGLRLRMKGVQNFEHLLF